MTSEAQVISGPYIAAERDRMAAVVVGAMPRTPESRISAKVILVGQGVPHDSADPAPEGKRDMRISQLSDIRLQLGYERGHVAAPSP